MVRCRRWYSIGIVSKASGPLGRPSQPTTQWAPGGVSRGWSGRSVKLTTHLHLVPRLIIIRTSHHYLILHVFVTDNFTNAFFTFFLKQRVCVCVCVSCVCVCVRVCELYWRTDSLWSPLVRLCGEALVSITTNIWGHLNFWFLLSEWLV
jgi:hypothetical protein